MVLDKSSSNRHVMLNLPSDEMIKLILTQLDNDIPVWFACDIGKYSSHKLNVMDVDLYNYGIPFDTSFTTMSKADRLDFYESYPSHAMAIIGYDISQNIIESNSNSNNDIKSNKKDDSNCSSDSSDSDDSRDINDDKKRKTNKVNKNNLKRKRGPNSNFGKKAKLLKRSEEINSKHIKIKTPDPDSVKVITDSKVISTKGKKSKKSEKEKEIKKDYEKKLNLLTKFKVENSWGDIGDIDGFYSMSVNWFNQYAFEIVINKEYLTDEQKKLLNTEPIKLKYKDPLSKNLGVNLYENLGEFPNDAFCNYQ
jgi:hypothetical protein